MRYVRGWYWMSAEGGVLVMRAEIMIKHWEGHNKGEPASVS